jgi:LuxR family transcriptional regulator, regulator of acetate metabolism
VAETTLTTRSASRTLAPFDFETALRHLGDFGPPSEVRSHTPRLAAEMLRLDRVLLSSIRAGKLFADALYFSAGRSDKVLRGLTERPVALDYPLVEGEIMRRRRPELIARHDGDRPQHCAFAEVMDWDMYVVAPLLAEGRVIGFLQGDRGPKQTPLQASDADALSAFALCFGVIYERAVLRHRLNAQRQEMRAVASWADARAGELGDRPISLEELDQSVSDGPSAALPVAGASGLRDLLTRRERDVAELMVRGDTNAAIARELVLSEGTVKFHVKNILRKLHASNRAEATSRYVRMTLDGRPHG